MVVISGAPGRKDREKDPLLHHKVKTLETQRRIYDEVTVASTVLLDEQRAASDVALRHVCATNARFTLRCRTTLLIGKFR